jgi:hypothetical protein
MKFSEKTVQRQTIWGQGGKSVIIQKESPVPDLKKFTEVKRFLKKFS